MVTMFENECYVQPITKRDSARSIILIALVKSESQVSVAAQLSKFPIFSLLYCQTSENYTFLVDVLAITFLRYKT